MSKIKYLTSIKCVIHILILSGISIPVFALSNSCEYTGPPAPLKGSMIAEEVRVMTMNVWGQTGPGEGGSDTKCEARLNYIGKKIANSQPAFNIVGLTEVHPDYAVATCDGKALVKGIQINGEYKKNKARWGHPEASWDENIGPDYDGGTSLFSTSEFDWKPYKEHVHQYPQDEGWRTAHGFIFSRIRINSEASIDVYVTHIHSNCDQQCRYNELKELAEGIHDRSANSGFPVLVMGDFNIRGPNPTAKECDNYKGYGDIMDLLRNPRDLWLEAHPNQAGTTYPTTKNKRIDYIFSLTDPYFTNSPYELVLSDPDDLNTFQWQMPGYYSLEYNPIEVIGSQSFKKWNEGPFRVSDHAGIDAMLEVRQRVSLAAILLTIF